MTNATQQWEKLILEIYSVWPDNVKLLPNHRLKSCARGDSVALDFFLNITKHKYTAQANNSCGDFFSRGRVIFGLGQIPLNAFNLTPGKFRVTKSLVVSQTCLVIWPTPPTAIPLLILCVGQTRFGFVGPRRPCPLFQAPR